MDKTYKVAIIGCGGISHMHTGWYLNEPRVSLTAVADVASERVEAYGEKYGIEKQWRFFYERFINFGGRGAELRALSALDLALWDIFGQSCDLPSGNF